MGGTRAEHLIFLCAFAPTPADLSCNADATWHGLVIGDEAVEAMMCCDAHLAVMAAIAHYVHPLVHPCGIPGSLFRWPENECYTDWDEAEFVTAEASVSAGAS